VCTSVTIASLTDIAAVRTAVTHDDGGIARAAALGVLFLLSGLPALVPARPTRR
jgi:hypothetical protein